MPKYRVFVTRETTETAVVEVEADTIGEAEDKAYDMGRTLEFTGDDYAGEIYISSSEEISNEAG